MIKAIDFINKFNEDSASDKNKLKTQIDKISVQLDGLQAKAQNIRASMKDADNKDSFKSQLKGIKGQIDSLQKKKKQLADQKKNIK